MINPRISIKTKEKVCGVSENLYGLFFEDINHAGDGGLYAELLRNRSFEDGLLPKDCAYSNEGGFERIISDTGWVSGFEGYNLPVGWEAENLKICLNAEDTLNPNRKASLDAVFSGGAVLFNNGWNGISVESGKKYRLTLFVKSAGVSSVSAQAGFYHENGEFSSLSDFCIKSNDYEKIEIVITAEKTDCHAKLAIKFLSAGSIRIGFSSLFPLDTFMGRTNGVRKDLALRLKELSPKFLRFPGGCIVEGFTPETAMLFENSIGPIEERKSHYLLWMYRTTLGLGFLEYLTLCEDLKIDAMYVCNCGLTCQARGPHYFEGEMLEKYLNDCLNALEYAMGGEDTVYGALRAKHGHPAPVKIKYLEIGNENYGEKYYERYKVFYDAVTKKYPELIIISDEHVENRSLGTDIVDEHFYADFDFFASNHDFYDDYPAEPKIYVGEYACVLGCEHGNMENALSEAAFLTGIERNQSKVIMTSYAPLFTREENNLRQWNPDMIVFNGSKSYVTPSYHVVRMFSENRGSRVVLTNVNSPSRPQNARGGIAVCHCGEGIFAKDALINGEIPKTFTDFDGRTEVLPDGSFKAFGKGENRLVIGDDGLKDYLAEISVKSDENGKIALGFWHSQSNGVNQNRYNWEISGAKSVVSHNVGWSFEHILSSTAEPLKPNEWYRLKIETRENTFSLYINGNCICRHTLKQIPDLTCVSSVDDDKNELIIKLVNTNSCALTADIRLDCIVPEQKAPVITLRADNLKAVNTMDSPDNVSPYTRLWEISGDNLKFSAESSSVNIIRIKL